MLAEGLQKLIDTARESTKAELSAHFPSVKGLPVHEIIKVTRDGKHEIIKIDAPPRSHSLRSVSELGGFVDYAINQLSGQPSVWITGGSVVVLINDKAGGWLNETAKVTLTQSPQFELLFKWEKNPVDFDHPEFLRMLRRYYSESINNLPALLKLLRTLKFQNGVAIASTADTKRQSIGREIAQSVEGADASELPEVLDIIVNVYDDATLDQKVVIRSMLDITAAGQFRLIPLAGGPLKAVDASLSAIKSGFLATLPETVPVFFGTP